MHVSVFIVHVQDGVDLCACVHAVCTLLTLLQYTHAAVLMSLQ